MKSLLHITTTILLLLAIFSTSLAQSDQPLMRYAIGEEGIYIYHTKKVPIGQGFNIYKKRAVASDFEKLNEQPITGVFYPDELPMALGDLYDSISQEVKTDTPRELFFTLRSNTVLGSLYTFVHPSVARVLGRLYIDTKAVAGEEITYKIEFVDDVGQPTGEIIEERLNLVPAKPATPQNVDVSNDGYAMDIRWNYPSTGNTDDKIIRFEIYQSEPGEEELQRINEKIILRDNNKTEYVHFFTANTLGVEKDYVIVPVDITGENGPVSERIRYAIKDNIAPGVVKGVSAEKRNGMVEVTWPVSPETDLAGYRIYRTTNIAEDFVLLQDDLIEPLNETYLDSAVSGGNTYNYQVTAVDRSGNEGPRSAVAVRLIADNTPPPSPTGLSAVYDTTAKEVLLRWSSENKTPDFRRYLVYRKKLSGQSRSIFGQITIDDYIRNEFRDEGIGGLGFEEGVVYKYGVVAADSSRNFSDTTTVILQVPDLTPPEPPINITADNRGGTRIDLTWNQSTSGDVVTYRIYKMNQDTGWTLFEQFPVYQRSTKDETIATGEKLQYAVSAIDSSGNVSKRALSNTVLARNFDPPRSVRNVQVSTIEDGIRITWEPVIAADLAGYKIYRSDISNGIFESISDVIVSELSWTDRNADQRYWYRVRAVDSSGNESRPSEPVRIK